MGRVLDAGHREPARRLIPGRQAGGTPVNRGRQRAARVRDARRQRRALRNNPGHPARQRSDHRRGWRHSSGERRGVHGDDADAMVGQRPAHPLLLGSEMSGRERPAPGLRAVADRAQWRLAGYSDRGPRVARDHQRQTLLPRCVVAALRVSECGRIGVLARRGEGCDRQGLDRGHRGGAGRDRRRLQPHREQPEGSPRLGSAGTRPRSPRGAVLSGEIRRAARGIRRAAASVDLPGSVRRRLVVRIPVLLRPLLRVAILL